MGSFSDYLENKWLSHTLKGSAFTKPSALYLGLSTADPTDSGSGIAEPSGGSYARVNVTTAFGTAAASRLISNSADITFPTATGSWGTISHWFISDAATGGNMLCHGQFVTAKSITSGQTAKILAGEIDISIPASNGMTTYLANEMLDHTFLDGDPGFSQPANLYVGLGTGAFGDNGAFTNEVANSGAYARVNVNAWTISGSAAENTNAITFPTATASWGTVSHHFIADSGSHGGGNMLYYGALDQSYQVLADDIVTYAAGAFDITQS